MHFVYILKLNNGDLYKGYTANIQERIRSHKSNKVDSTKYKNPILIHYEYYLKESDARRRERFLKTTEGRRLLQQQLRDILKEPL